MSFGKRGLKASSMPVSQAAIASQTSGGQFHGSHFELHWPKYAGALFAGFGVVYLVIDGKSDPLTLLIVGAVAYFVAFRVTNSFRKSVNDLHDVRTQLFRSRPFLIGALAGLALYLYFTFIDPIAFFGFAIGGNNPLADGWQQADFATVATILLGGAGFMVLGGGIAEFVAKLLRGNDASSVSGGGDQR